MDPIAEAISNLSKRIRKLESRSHSLGFDYICFTDQKSVGVDGGSATGGIWQARIVNTEISNENNHATLDAINGRLTLHTGDYYCSIKCPAFRTDYHKAKLINFGTSAVILMGSSESAASGSGVLSSTSSLIVGKFSLAAATTIAIQQYFETAKSTDGMGKATGSGVEIYTIAEFWRKNDA